jgi:multidrug efflux system membrane fusion protein
MQGPPPPAVGVATVELREVAPTSELTGRVEAVHRVDVRARVSGYVTAVRYHEGAEVAAGAALFAIDARPYQAAFARASAELARARARVELARTEADRGEKLLAASAIARAERDALMSGAAQAAAEVAGAQASLELARLDLEFTQVRAPVAGRSGRAAVSIGDYVAAGAAPLTSVVSVDPVYVYFTGDEQTYLRFASHAEHTPVAIGLADEVGFPHAGQVDFVDNRIEASSGTILVRAVVANPDKRLAPGLFARVQLPEGSAVQAMLVDDKAILTDQDRKYVYVLAGDTVERRDVKLGRIIAGRRVIAEGVKVGDQVIVNGVQKVFPGAKATVAKPPEQAATNGSVP